MLNLIRHTKLFFTTTFSVLILITGYNVSVNGHYHKMADGSIIFHSHPYNTSDTGNGNSHHHSKKDIAFLALLSGGSFTNNIINISVSCNSYSETEYLTSYTNLLEEKIINSTNSERAPPYFYNF